MPTPKAIKKQVDSDIFELSGSENCNTPDFTIRRNVFCNRRQSGSAQRSTKADRIGRNRSDAGYAGVYRRQGRGAGVPPAQNSGLRIA